MPLLSPGSIMLASGAAIGLGASLLLTTRGNAASSSSSSTNQHPSRRPSSSNRRRPPDSFPRVARVTSPSFVRPRTARLVKVEEEAGIRRMSFRVVPGPFGSRSEEEFGTFPLSHFVIKGTSFAVDEAFAFGKKCAVRVSPIKEADEGRLLEVAVRAPDWKETSLVFSKTTGKAASGKPTNKESNTKREEEGTNRAFLGSLLVGDEVEILGPRPTVTDAGGLREALATRKRIVFIAGGTGITPFLQLAEFDDDDPSRFFTLLWSHRNEDDVKFCAKKLEELAPRKTVRAGVNGVAAGQPPRFEVYHTLTRRVPKGWTEGVGRISTETLHRCLPPPSPDVVVVVCGPDGFVRAVAGGELAPAARGAAEPRDVDRWVGEVGGMLAELGYKSDQVIRL